ncbi:MAG: SRPBCC domain-containing protein [Phycisphaerae bacterium]|nr:SRPBCC domain-containing protein [Phycisphaerae bacterium]
MSASAKPRTFEMSLDIAAPVEDVWKALTEAKELTRWFPPEARVEPGVNGSVYLAWGEQAPFVWNCKITAWEPNRHVRWSEELHPGGDKSRAAVPVSMDFHLEGKGGSTVLRLVHSGFTTDSAWDAYFDGISHGWAFELRSLQHYAENHFGQDRRVVWVRTPVAENYAGDTARLIGEKGAVLRGRLEGLKAGDGYEVELVDGDDTLTLKGRVVRIGLPRIFAGTVDNLNNALFRYEVETCGGTGPHAWWWLATYGLPEKTFADVDRRFRAAVERACPAGVK